MKTLKQILEVYKPKSPDEKKFVDKHIVVKQKDRNGNGDDVFQATNIKTVGRKDERHGYDPNEDEKVYEEVDIDEGIRSAVKTVVGGIKKAGHLAAAKYYDRQSLNHPDDEESIRLGVKSNRHKIMAGKKVSTVVDPEKYLQATKNEEVEYVEEKAKWRTDANDFNQEPDTGNEDPSYVPPNNRPGEDQEQGTLTDRKGLPTRKLKKAIQSTLGTKRGRPIGRLPEETEHLEEKLKVSDGIGAWISDFVHSKNPNFAGKSKKERTQMALGAFYSAKRGE